MNVLALGALAVAGVAAQANIYTSTKAADVAAAAATAKTSQPTSNVKGKVCSQLEILYILHTSDSSHRSSIAS
jgi:hypothetical protein